jgi:hypothetical protein
VSTEYFPSRYPGEDEPDLSKVLIEPMRTTSDHRRQKHSANQTENQAEDKHGRCNRGDRD